MGEVTEVDDMLSAYSHEVWIGEGGGDGLNVVEAGEECLRE